MISYFLGDEDEIVMKSGTNFLDSENFLKLHFNVQYILFGEN